MAVSYDVVLQALIEAARAHGIHEQQIGHADSQWPAWYAHHIVAALTSQGYELRQVDR